MEEVHEETKPDENAPADKPAQDGKPGDGDDKGKPGNDAQPNPKPDDDDEDEPKESVSNSVQCFTLVFLSHFTLFVSFIFP